MTLDRSNLAEARQLIDALNDEKRYAAESIVAGLVELVEVCQEDAAIRHEMYGDLDKLVERAEQAEARLIGAVAQKEFLQAAIKTYVPNIWNDISKSLEEQHG